MPKGIATISYGSSLLTIRAEFISTRAKLNADPRTTLQRDAFGTFAERWSSVFRQELTLSDEQIAAQSLVERADDVLDSLIDGWSAAVGVITNNNKDHALYQFYFGAKPPSQLKRPVLGDELEYVRGKLESLTSSEHASLQQLGAKLAEAVKQADEAVRRRDAADAAMAQFRHVGDRHRMLDELNALRDKVHGELSQIAHAHQQEQLPGDWAASFFRFGPRKPSARQLTVQDYDDRIEELERQLAELRADRLAVVTRLESDKAQAEARAADEAELARLHVQAAALEKKLAKKSG